MASVDRRPNGTYRVRWREYPGGPQRTRTYKRKAQADKHADKVAGELVSGTYVDPDAGRERFVDWLDAWADAQDWKPTTRETWPTIRTRLVDAWGDRPLASIGTLTMQTLQRELGDGLARQTVVVTMAKARAALRAAYTNGRIPRDPTIGLQPPKARGDDRDRRVGPDEVPTRDEALRILAAAPARYRAAIALGLTGLRIGEVLGLTADRIALDTRQVTVDRQAQRIGGATVLTSPKSEKARTITVPGLVAVELRRHLRTYGSDGLLWPAGDGAPMRSQNLYVSGWRPALVTAGLEPDRFRFHSLRHFCASTLLAEGAPITAVAGHLGDIVPTVVKTYAHWLRDDRDVPAEVLDRVLAADQSEQAAQ